MDNVLIDDRRIHVDFSQSVSKNYTWDRQTTGEHFLSLLTMHVVIRLTHECVSFWYEKALVCVSSRVGAVGVEGGCLPLGGVSLTYVVTRAWLAQSPKLECCAGDE